MLRNEGLERQMSIYGGRDPREVPAYSFADAGRLLTVNPSTIRNWAKGHEHFRPVLTISDDLPKDAVSFFNLIEIFVLDELRRRHRFSLQQLRPHILYMQETFPDATYPLAQIDLFVSNNDLFGRFGRSPLVNISRGGQLALEEVLRDLLQRVERGPSGEGIVKLFPFITRQRAADSPRAVEVNPRVRFGRPVICGHRRSDCGCGAAVRRRRIHRQAGGGIRSHARGNRAGHPVRIRSTRCLTNWIADTILRALDRITDIADANTPPAPYIYKVTRSGVDIVYPSAKFRFPLPR